MQYLKYLLIVFTIIFITTNALAINFGDTNVNALDGTWVEQAGNGWTIVGNDIEKVHTGSLGYVHNSDWALTTSENWFFEGDITLNGSSFSVDPFYVGNTYSSEAGANQMGFRVADAGGGQYYLKTDHFNGTDWINKAVSIPLNKGTEYHLELRYYGGKLYSYLDENQMVEITFPTYDINYIVVLDYDTSGATTSYFSNLNFGYNQLLGTPYVLSITSPTTGNQITGTTDLNINIQDTNRELTPQLKVYYSTIQGNYDNLIYSDTNLLDGTGFVCDSYDFSTLQNCSYDWNTLVVADGNYFIDANVFNTDYNTLASGGEFEINNYDIDANFTNVISSTAQTITLTDTTIGTNVTPNDWNWLIDGVITGLDNANAQNPIFSGATQNTDYNIALSVSGLGTDGNTYNGYIEQTVSTGRWFGLLHATTWDENSELALETNLNFNGNDYNLSNEIWIDLNTLGATSSAYTLTFSKTGYVTRTFAIDLNKYSDLNLSMLMLPSTKGRSVEFQMYKTDKTTLYSNTGVELLNNGNDWNSAGRGTTSATGTITFFINPNDSNYTLRIYDSPVVDYNSMSLTISKPKKESDGLVIDGNWEVEVTGLAWQTYSNLAGSQAIQVYANTVGNYGLTIGDTLANYYDRKYYVSYLGGTTAETLQPYLVDVNNAVSTTIYTISGYTQQPVGSVTIQIYKTVPTDGRVLVEQVVTDAKGAALISLIANEEYEFVIYRNGLLVGNDFYRVTSTSTTIYLTLDDVGLVKQTLGQGSVSVLFTPSRGKLIGSDTTLTQTITINDKNFGISFVSAHIYITNNDVNGVLNNDVNVWSKIITTTTNSITIDSTTQLLDSNWYDTNGSLTIYVVVTTTAGTYVDKYVYKPVVGFDVYKALGFDLRPVMGCSSTNDPLIPCGPMLFIALFVSLIITIGFAIETGFTGQEGMAGLFLVIMGIFTYLSWVPIGLMALLAVSVIMLMIAIGGRNRL
jgi:hypothetical protein